MQIKITSPNVNQVKNFDFANSLIDLEYRDELTDKSDSLSITLTNQQLDNLSLFLRGDLFEAELIDDSGKSLKTGVFQIDSKEANFDNSVLTVAYHGLTMQTYNNSLLTQYSCFFAKTTLKKLLETVAKKIGHKLIYSFSGGDVSLLNVRHKNIFIGNLLKEYAEKLGAVLKIFDKKIIFADIQYFAKKSSVIDFDIAKIPVNSMRYSESSKQETEIEVRYFNPDTREFVKPKATTKNTNSTAKRKRVVVTRISGLDEAQAVAEKANNQFFENIEIETVGKSDYVAGAIIEIKNAFSLNGKYLLTSVNHRINSTSWDCSLSGVRLY